MILEKLEVEVEREVGVENIVFLRSRSTSLT
jgi:hypothetical protein